MTITSFCRCFALRVFRSSSWAAKAANVFDPGTFCEAMKLCFFRLYCHLFCVLSHAVPQADDVHGSPQAPDGGSASIVIGALDRVVALLRVHAEPKQ